MAKKTLFHSILLILLFSVPVLAKDLKIGLNYPRTGPYSVQGEAQYKSAMLAAKEINKAGGINGRQIKIIAKDSKSVVKVAENNVKELIDVDGCEMIFGGSASSVAIAAGKIAKSRKKIYFGTLTYSNDTTVAEGHKYMFRECYNAWMAARALTYYLRESGYTGKRFFYITADYTWGRTTESSFRKFSNTSNKRRHKSVLTPFPGAETKDFESALKKAAASKATVLVLVLFGKDMSTALQMAYKMGLKQKMDAVVVPNLTLGMAQATGPEIMEGVVGSLPWCWKVPYLYGYDKGKSFVEKYLKQYQSYPSTSAASAYTILYQYKDAVERAGTIKTDEVIQSLEGHRFVSLKDEQSWRKFDHQCVQTVYAVRCRSAADVKKSLHSQDFFEIVDSMSGGEAARNKFNWKAARRKAGKPPFLEW
ncbi:ABC transporter substrate-binding protein [Desulfobacterales bacterium HSG16]|nr:ABC transporter substrate-binding protein [Desulfobacterales bacterium HSG16]